MCCKFISRDKDKFESNVRNLQKDIKQIELTISNDQKDVDRLTREVYELTCRKDNYNTELKRQISQSLSSSSSNSSQIDRKLVLQLRKKLKTLMNQKKDASAVKIGKENLVASFIQKIQQLNTL